MGTLRTAAVMALVHVVALAGIAAGEIRYVAVGGNDWGSDCTSVPCAGTNHAIAQANAGDTIIIGSGVFVETGSIVIQKALTIQGSGPGSTVVKPSSPVNAFVVGSLPGFSSKSNYQVTIKGLEIREGWVGLHNDSTLTLENASAEGGANAGGIANAGVLIMHASLVAGNTGYQTAGS
jgi:hypothetical protein